MRCGLALLLLLVGCGGGGLGEIGSTKETYDGPFGLISVTAETGRIEVVAGGASDTIEVEFLPNGSDTWIADEGDDLTLIATCMGGDEVGCGGGFILTVPSDQLLELRTQVGSIDLGAELQGDITAQTASAGVRGAALGAAAINVLTGTGAVDVSFQATPRSIDVDTGSSAITVSVPSGGYALDVTSTSEVTIASSVTDDASGPPLRARSGTGVITISGS